MNHNGSSSTNLPDSFVAQMIMRRNQCAASSATRNRLLIEEALSQYDEDQNVEEMMVPHGGSRPGKQPNIPRDFEASYQRLLHHYFSDRPLYNEVLFRCQFRISRPVFFKIANAVQQYDNYFTQKPDALGKMGIHPLVKITGTLQILAYGEAGDFNDEYLQISETTSLESMDRFCNSIVALFESEYLRQPTREDLGRLLKVGEKRGFPGMLGSVDCMHWEWKNYPSAWAGQFQGKEKVSTVILEAVAIQDLWIWHANFGLPGSHNDLNVLDRSDLFKDLLNGVSPKCHFTINGNHYENGYYLADGIYPDWSVFVKTLSQPQGLDQKHFVKLQEACRKDVERAFGVLQAWFAVVSRPARGWKHHNLRNIMKACIILHNMIVEDERDSYLDYCYDPNPLAVITPVEVVHHGRISFSQLIDNYHSMKDSQAHHKLRQDLIKHQWQLRARQII